MEQILTAENKARAKTSKRLPILQNNKNIKYEILSQFIFLIFLNLFFKFILQFKVRQIPSNDQKCVIMLIHNVARKYFQMKYQPIGKL